MAVYRLRADCNHYLNCYLSPDEIEAMLGDYFLLDNPTRAEFWKPVKGFFQDDSDSGGIVTPPDITLWYTSNNLVLNQRAYDALGEHLEAYGELLLVTCEGVPYWLLHVTKRTEMDAVDNFQSERIIDEGGFADVQRLAFKEDVVGELLIFQTPFTGYRNLYCTEAFRSLVNQSELKGLLFQKSLVSII